MSIFQYSWFIVIAVGIAFSSLFSRYSDQTLVAKGLSRAEVNSTYTTVSVTMAITAGMIGINQVIAGIQNPFYLYSPNLDNVNVLAGKGVLTSFWVAFALWVWFSRGYKIYETLVLPFGRYQGFITHLGLL